MTMADANKDLVKVIKSDLLAQLPNIEQALPATAKKYLTPERVTKVALMAISQNPILLKCDRMSILTSVMTTTSLGLELGSALGHAYLVPFWNNKRNCYEAQPIIGFRGYIALARRSGELSTVMSQVVYEKDFFDIDLGSGEPPKHKPYLDGDRGAPKLVYSVARFKDGGGHIEVMTWHDVQLIKQRALANKKNKDFSPWSTDETEMARKTVIRRASKYWPISIEFANALDVDNQVDSGDYNVDTMIPTLEPIEPAADEPIEIKTKAEQVLDQLRGKDDPAPPAPKKAPKKKDDGQWLDVLKDAAKAKGMSDDDLLFMADNILDISIQKMADLRPEDFDKLAEAIDRS